MPLFLPRTSLLLATAALLGAILPGRAPAGAGSPGDVTIRIVGSAHDRGEIKPCG